MANLISDNEIFYTKFEPRLQNRFIMYVEGVPSFLIKKVSRPKIEFGEVVLDHINLKRKFKGKANWPDINMTLYEAIVPSAAQGVFEWIRTSHESTTGRDGYADFYKRDVTINELGPVGDKIGEWTLHGAFVKSYDGGELDWSSDQPIEVSISLSVDRVTLKY